MGQSSARPDNLKAYQTSTGVLDTSIETSHTTLSSALSSFVANNNWGSLDASGLVANVAEFTRLNREDARWVNAIGDAFRAADASGSVAYATDAEIASSLQAQGIPSNGRVDITVDPSVATGGQQTTGYANDPVSAASGNFLEVETDLGFGPSLGDLQVRRTFNSLDDADGPFGRGWSSWASTRLSVDSSGEWADWRGPDGQVARIPMAEGRCPGFEGQVSVTAEGMIAEFPKEATVWTFDRLGRPVDTTRGPGTGVRFEWDGQQLVGLAHVRGRRIDFEWNSDRIVAATSDDGRRVTYTYDDTRHLVAVDGPMGARRYEVSETGLLLSVTDADGVVAAANTYDERGRVLTQRTEFGRLVRFHYQANVVTLVDDDDGGPVNRYEHDRYGRLLKIVDGHGGATTRDYDAKGRVTAVTDRNHAVTRYEWDDHDRQVAVTTPDGVRVETRWDDLHRPVAVSRNDGATTTFAYTGEERDPTEVRAPDGGVTRFEIESGLVRRVIDPDGVTVTLGYDEQGRLLTATDALGGVLHQEWDASGQLIAAVSPAGARTELDRDPAGRVIARREPNGGVTRIERSPAGRVVATVDPVGNRRTFERGDHGHVVDAVDELGATTSLTYDPFGNVVSRALPGGGKWTVGYDALMRPVATTDPAGATWLREYDAEGQLVGTFTPEGIHRSMLVDATGRVAELHDGVASARFEYDHVGRPVAQTRPDGTRASGRYDAADRLTSITEPNGGTSTIEYSPGGRILAVHGPEGGVSRFRYDDAGRLVAATDPTGSTRRFRLDADGRVTRIIDATGETTRFRYDLAGQVVAEIDPAGGETRHAYDLAGRRTSTTDPSGATTQYEYDAAGRLVAVTDPNGGVTALERDPQGRVVAETDPLGGVTRRTYDEVGQLLSHTDPSGATTSLRYDGSGRLVRRLDPDGRRWRWNYDASDRITSWGADAEFEVTIEHDLLGRAVRITDDRGSVVERSWDRAGRLVAETTTTPAGSTRLTWRYDQVDRPVACAVNGRETTTQFDPAGRTAVIDDPQTGPIEIERDGHGRATELRHGGGREERSWADGRLATWTRTSVDGTTRSATFERDAAGRIVSTVTSRSRETEPGPSQRQTAGYDAAGQLVALTGDDGDHRFTYDAGGRLVGETGPAGTAEYRYDAAGRLLRADRPSGVTELSWDVAGRRLAEDGPDGTRRYGYDAAGRLASITSGPAGGPNARVRTLHVDPLDRLAAVDDVTLAWDPTAPFDQLRAIGDRAVVSAAGTPVAAADPGGTVSWLDRDQRGTVGATDPFGQAAGPPSGLDIGFAGELTIEGQVWLRARLYDPATRAFTTPDPLPSVLGSAWSANPYHFAGNDPLNRLDPSGLRPLSDAELDQVRADMQKGAWDRYGGYVVGGLLIVGGIALMATGVGGVLGAVLIGAAISGGVSAISQQYTTGGVNWGQVGVDMLIGAAAGGAGGLAGSGVSRVLGTAVRSPVGRAAIVGTTDGMVGGMTGRALNGENPFDPKSMGLDLVTGGALSAGGAQLGRRNPAFRSANGERWALSAERPHIIRDPASGAPFTPQQIDEARRYSGSFNDMIERGTQSATGRVPTSRTPLGRQAQRYTTSQRAAHPDLYPDGSVVPSHIPDSGWTGIPDGPITPQSSRFNSVVAGQNGTYPVGYKPTGSWYTGDFPGEGFHVGARGVLGSGGLVAAIGW